MSFVSSAVTTFFSTCALFVRFGFVVCFSFVSFLPLMRMYYFHVCKSPEIITFHSLCCSISSVPPPRALNTKQRHALPLAQIVPATSEFESRSKRAPAHNICRSSAVEGVSSLSTYYLFPLLYFSNALYTLQILDLSRSYVPTSADGSPM